MTKKNKTNKGFTLIETVVAILLLMMTVTAIMELVSKVLISTRGYRLEVTAQYLMQEGIEYLRNNRDSALNGGAAWSPDFTQFGPGPCGTIGVNTVSLCPCIYANGTPGSCTINPLNDEVSACPSTGCPALIKIENSGRTIMCAPGSDCPGSYTNLGQTTFVRTIRLTPSQLNPDELLADITVSWLDFAGVSRTKTINTSLLNW